MDLGIHKASPTIQYNSLLTHSNFLRSGWNVIWVSWIWCIIVFSVLPKMNTFTYSYIYIIPFIDISINKCFRQDVAFVPSKPIMLNNFQSTVDIEQYVHVQCTFIYSIWDFLCDLTNDHLTQSWNVIIKTNYENIWIYKYVCNVNRIFTESHFQTKSINIWSREYV